MATVSAAEVPVSEPIHQSAYGTTERTALQPPIVEVSTE